MIISCFEEIIIYYNVCFLVAPLVDLKRLESFLVGPPILEIPMPYEFTRGSCLTHFWCSSMALTG